MKKDNENETKYLRNKLDKFEAELDIQSERGENNKIQSLERISKLEMELLAKEEEIERIKQES